MVRKDLKVKYQGSALGFLWSLANPLLLMAIYYFVFGIILKSGIPDFAIFIMAGLLPWSAFSSAVVAGTGSVVANAGLVKKVRFPLQVLPLSSVGYAMVHFVMQLVPVLLIALLLHRHYSPAVLLLIPATALLVLLATAFSYLLSAANVRYRDTAHFVELAILVWFWTTPIVYPTALIRDHLHGMLWLYFLNPMATVVACFQRAIYVVDRYPTPGGGSGHALADPGYLFYAWNLLLGLVIAGALALLARWNFRRMQAGFAEDL
jgi:ABC-2 type transport system permease protein